MSHSTLNTKFLRSLVFGQRMVHQAWVRPRWTPPSVESLMRIAGSILVGVLLIFASGTVASDADRVGHFLSGTKMYGENARQPGAVQSVVVPSLVGYSARQAYDALHAAGLRPRLERRVEPEMAPNVVLTQTTGTVAPGSIVTVGVNVSQGRIPAPAVKRLTEPQAQALLARSGLATDTVGAQFTPEVPAGQVMKELPPAGSAMPRDGIVQLVLSAGAPPVPQLLGMSFHAAESEAARSGLKLQVDGPVAAGKEATVIAQNPQPGPGLLATNPLIHVKVASGSSDDAGGVEQTTPHDYTNIPR